MSSGQQHGRGGSSGASRRDRDRGGGDRGVSRGGESRGSRGDGQSRGGRGDRGGSHGRGGGGPPGRGESTQIASRGGQPSGGIYLSGSPVPQPDPTITAAENALVTLTRGRTFEGFPGRRGYGTKGKAIILRTNYFKIDTPFDSNDPGIVEQTLYRYKVYVDRPTLTRPKKHRLLVEILRHHKFADKVWATDYGDTILTTKKLDLGPNNEWKHDVTLSPEEGTTTAVQQEGPAPRFVKDARARNHVYFTVTYNGSFRLQHIIDYLRSESAGAEYAAQGDVVSLLNIIMCKPPQGSPTVANVGQNKFYPFEGHPGMERYDIGGALQAFRGYFASVRPAVNRLLLNLNVTSGAFYKPMPLIQLVQDSGLRTNEQREVFLKKLKVKVEYRKDGQSAPFMTKIKTITSFAKQLDPPTFRVKRFGNAEDVKFRYIDRNTPNSRAQEISVVDYFEREHGITLQHPNYPVLNVGIEGDPQYIPPELCTVLKGQAYRNFLGANQTSEMIKFAARYPNLNAMSIAGTPEQPGNGVRLFRLADPPPQNPQSLSVKLFGFGVNTQMITVPGRVLDGPRVTYGNNQNLSPRGGSWNCANQKFSIPGRVGKWQVLVINGAGPRGSALIDSPRGDMLAPEPLFAELQRHLTAYGLTMGQRVTTQTITLDSLVKENRPSNNRKIRTAFQKAKEQDVRMLFVVLPEQDKWLYARIKYYGDIEFGIHSINAVGSKLQRPQGQGMFMGNLALKFNIKGGGVSHKVSNVLASPLDNNTMLVGVDVTHPSPNSAKDAPSIACVVASVDEHLFQWPGSIRTQAGKVEMVQDLRDMVLERLMLWRKKHNKYPSKIIIYRDGVSEGQYKLVLDREIPPFEEAFTKTYGEKKNWPKLAVIVVGKRHHTRFYPTRPEDADYDAQRQRGSWNPLPGTIVDRGISGRIIREFWLQPHQGLQGTARPAHYVVIRDDLPFEADELEQFTHKMCYTFNRATKAVSVCPPAYYADLLCERGRAYLFSTLAENHGSDSSVFSASNAEWTGGVHQNLAESTWYI